MTPKEKAIELCNKFIRFVIDWNYAEDRPLPLGEENEYCKQCALIAVDGIINALIEADADTFTLADYEAIKEEIQKL